MGAACSRDRFNSRLQAAPTGVFLGYLSLPDTRIKKYEAMDNVAGLKIVDSDDKALRTRKKDN